ncbi:unnamed protein product [Cochlearia groenlandica]
MESNSFIFDPSVTHGNFFFLENLNPMTYTILGSKSKEETSKRRCFLTSTDEYELYKDHFSSDKKRRLTTKEVNMLEKSFETENKLEPERKTELANKLCLQPRQVSVWFQNRRARSKTKQLERDYDLLKTTYDQLLSNYHSISMDNHILRSQVTSLTDKLKAKQDKTNQPNQHEPITVNQFSTGTTSSVIVDEQDEEEEEEAPPLLDSCDSYFPTDNDPTCCFDDVFVPATLPSHHHAASVSLGFWSWP